MLFYFSLNKAQHMKNYFLMEENSFILKSIFIDET